MAAFTNYWQIITPKTRKEFYNATDAYDPRFQGPGMGSSTAISWYSTVLRGPGSRTASYKMYDQMDRDIDIARSLDIIAEEMTNRNEKTGLPFNIVYNKEDNEDISDTTSVTLRQALRTWVLKQDLERRMFMVARSMIKYGDTFFRKTSDTRRWTPIDPAMVYGIEVDDDGHPHAYHIRKILQTQTLGANATQEFERIPAEAIVHFSLAKDMGDSAPFGQSVLSPIFKVYRQMSMLEDAVIIYRIVRAPERRIFYIDTGNMPAQKVRAYLENIKTEMRQKRVPGATTNGTKDVVDGQYDPQSMMEDFYFPVTASGRGSRVETLPGGTEDFGINLLKHFQDKMFRGLRIPTSYMTGTDGQGAQYNDGKVGVAYIEEMRFANYVRRLQECLENVYDEEFKMYLKVCGIQTDPDIFRIKLPDPANFALYRQAALDSDLISSFNNIESNKYLSRRFILKRYLGLTDDELQMNEVMLKEERDLSDDMNVTPMQAMYDPSVYENIEAHFHKLMDHTLLALV